jgi:PKD repeat protein
VYYFFSYFRALQIIIVLQKKQNAMKKIILLLTITLCFSSNFITAQKWVQMMNDPNVNFYEVQKEFYAYWKDRKIEKGHGYKQFKRWEYIMQTRVDANGKLPPAGYADQQLTAFQARHANEKISGTTAAWSAIGPNTSVGLEDGIGRVECLAIDASAPNTYWAGTPGGGLWKSTNSGVTWVPKTDNFVSLGIGWILIDPSNANIMYVSTGDPDGGGTYSTGVLKSMDGGTTWTQTSLNFTTDQYKQINQLRFLPGNSSVILAATTDGIYRTTNGGTSWTLVKNNIRAFDIEFHPTTPSIVYAATNGAFIKSTDSGVTWTDMTSGIVTNGQRTAIEVTANAPDNVYCLTTESQDYKALFKSTNKGVSFTNTNVTVSIGAQAWWDLVFKVSPTNQNTIYIGGVWMNRSDDGGATWNNSIYIHADNHNMYFIGSDLFICNDGGLYRSSDNGVNWVFLGNNMQIMQFYRISSYLYDSNFLIGGSQDNGTARLKSGAWKHINCCDGMDNAISTQTSDVVWTSIQNGPLYKSTDGGITNNSVNGNINETGAWVTPFVMDPANPDIVYAGFNSLWKTTVGGTTWTKLGTPQDGSLIEKIAMDWSNPNNIYVVSGNSYFKTINGGTTWTNISSNSTDALFGHAIILDPKNSNRIWAATTGPNAGKKIYYSANGGTSWTNVSGTFPDVPIICMIYAPNSNDGIYVGTDVGIFYKDASMSDWMQFNDGLPNVRVEDLEINLGSGKILAGTYGRGIWSSPLHDDANAKPLADFDASSKGGCPGATINFTNYSANATSWSWSFPGGTPATSTAKNPTVTYNTQGNFNVSLVATSALGSNTKTRNGLISISGQIITTYPYVQNFDSDTVGKTNFTKGWVNGTDDEKDWFVHTGVAPARAANPKVGPSGDHTSGQGKYALFESLNASYSKAYLYSPCFTLSGITNPIFEFYEHVWGDDYSGELHVDILSNGGWNLDVIPMVSQIGDFWFKKTIDLSAYANQTIRIRFRAMSAYSKDFALDDISVKAKPTVAPVANFVATITSEFIGFSTQFFDQSDNLPTSYSWSFPGGTPSTSTVANPEVVYNVGGLHDVTLTATNAYGSNTLTKTAYINVNDAVYTMNNQTVANCVGQVYDPSGPNADYINNELKTFTIIPPGAQQVKLDVKEWGMITGDYLTVYDGTSVNAPVIANWTGGFIPPTTVTANSGAMTLKFASDAANTNIGFKLEWHAVGGTTCSPGTTVQKPVAAFSSSATTGVAPVTFNLQDNSTNTPTGWIWITPGADYPYYYGNVPSVTYSNPGTYDVTLVAVNEGGRDTLKKTGFFTVTEPIAEVNMYTGTVTNCKGNLYDDGGPNANYTDGKTYTLLIQPSGATSISMNFTQWGLESGYDFLKIYNGTSVSAPLIGNYSAASPGTVTANSGAMTLRFTSDANTNGVGWKASWTATGGSCSPVITPVADFSAAPTSVNTGTPVQFTDLSTNIPTSWSWTFTGGTPATSTAKNPSVTYAAAGTYAVSLTATNSAGSNTKTKNAYITVTQVVAPVADFSATPTSVNTGAPVQFTDLSTNTPTSWSWTFTGGTPATSTAKNPSVTYAAAGTYAVSLTATNSAGSNTKTKTAYIAVTAATVINMQNATITSCAGTLYDDGGPSANYGNSKTYTLVIQPSGATSVSMNFSQWGLESGFDFLKIYNGTSVSAPLLGNYSATSPGTVTANSGAMTLRFTSDAATNGIGWKSTWTAVGGTCSTPVTPVADFSAAPTNVGTSTPVQFTDLSTNTPTSWSWTFTGGTPATSTAKNPSVTYAAVGTYSVSLTATNAAGSNTKTKTAYITVTAPTVINMQNATVTTCTGTLYDDGGPSANYTNSKTYTLVLQPTGATSLSMTFSQWGLESGYDFLKIYNGTSVSAPLIGSYSATTPGTVTANSGAMTLRFTSDANTTGIGWKSTWTAVGCTAPPNGMLITGVQTISDEEKGLFIYPNPSFGEFTVVLNKSYSQLTIKNITGHLIEKMMLSDTDKSFNINLTTYPKGVYFVECSGPDGACAEKIIVQ